MEQEIIQIWVCSKCKFKERTAYIENPNLRKCLRCGSDLIKDKAIKIKKTKGLILP